MEIEKKFIIHYNEDTLNMLKKEYGKEEITQDYLYVDKYTAIRKRKILVNNITKYFYTVKTMKTGISVNEIEKCISQNEYDNLIINKNYNTIIKDRYIIPYINNLKIELDIFHGIYEGIAFAEIEFKDEKQANEIKIPEWFGKDISSLFTNSQMALKNIKEEILKIEN